MLRFVLAIFGLVGATIGLITVTIKVIAQHLN